VSQIAFALLGILAIGEFLLFGAVAEAFRDIAQLRRETGVIDELHAVDLGEAFDRQPSSFGLDPSLDCASEALVLFVDTRCQTCQLIVRSLNGALPLGTSLILFAESDERGIHWLDSNGFVTDRLCELPVRVATPEDPNPLGVDITPLAVLVQNGKIARALAVPSTRRFYSLVPDPHRLNARPTISEVTLDV
jgi:hypothetical protein